MPTNSLLRGAISSQLTTWGKTGYSLSKLPLELRRRIPLRTPNSVGASSSEKALQRLPSSRSTLEQIPLREILLLEEILG
jgi:hypothetical protein